MSGTGGRRESDAAAGLLRGESTVNAGATRRIPQRAMKPPVGVRGGPHLAYGQRPTVCDRQFQGTSPCEAGGVACEVATGGVVSVASAIGGRCGWLHASRPEVSQFPLPETLARDPVSPLRPSERSFPSGSAARTDPLAPAGRFRRRELSSEARTGIWDVNDPRLRPRHPEMIGREWATCRLWGHEVGPWALSGRSSAWVRGMCLGRASSFDRCGVPGDPKTGAGSRGFRLRFGQLRPGPQDPPRLRRHCDREGGRGAGSAWALMHQMGRPARGETKSLARPWKSYD